MGARSQTTLGSLCRRGHDHDGTGKSARDRHGRCVECRNLKGRERDRKRYSQRRYMPRYRKTNREFARRSDKRNTEYQRARRADDERFAVLTRLRVRLNDALRRHANGKTHPASEYGIDYAAIIAHLGPCPGPRSEYHVDHVRPLCSFDLTDPEQVREAFAPENHQWLTATDNLTKGTRIGE